MSKKIRKDKGKKHPGQKLWHASMTIYEKIKYRQKISDSMKKFHANKSEAEAKQKSDRVKAKKRAFFTTRAGREEKEYRSYFFTNFHADRDPEAQKITNAKHLKYIRSVWDNISPEDKAERMKNFKSRKNTEISNLIEFNVPREVTYCGVVRESA